MVLDDVKGFIINITQPWGSDQTYDSNDIACIGDGLTMNYTKLGENEYNHLRWFTYYIRNKQGLTQTMHVHTSYQYYCQLVDGHVCKPWYTEDGINWSRCESQWVWDDPAHTVCGTDYGTFTYWFTPTSQYCQVSQNFPWNYSQNEDFINAFNGNSYALVSVKAKSPKGRNVTMLELTNFSVPETSKKHVAMIGRQHAGETLCQPILIKMIQYIMSKSYLLDNIHWYFVPEMNPDGAYGDDPARQFQQWNTDNIPEVVGVRDFLATVDSNYGLDVFFDWHSLGSGYPENNNLNTGDTAGMTMCTNYLIPRWNGRYNCASHNYSQAVAYSYAYHVWGAIGMTPEPSQIDWTVTMDILQNDAEAVAEAIYDYFF